MNRPKRSKAVIKGKVNEQNRNPSMALLVLFV